MGVRHVASGIALGVAMAVSLVACGEEQVAQAGAWGSAEGVRAFGRFYLAGQPDAAGLEAGREAGIGVVVNLRQPHEHDWDEAAAAEALGLRYFEVPIDGRKPLPPEALDRIDAIVAESPDEPVLVHCASGQRAAAWLAVHLVEERGMDADRALAIGRQAGLSKPALEERVRQHLGASAGAGS